VIFFGGAEGDRTPDLMTASHALSQLSYSPERKGASYQMPLRLSTFYFPVAGRIDFLLYRFSFSLNSFMGTLPIPLKAGICIELKD
jgi:hypothetical protein